MFTLKFSLPIDSFYLVDILMTIECFYFYTVNIIFYLDYIIPDKF